MSVELEVVEREPVELTTTAIIPAPAAGWSLELDRTATHIRVRQVRGDETTPWMDVVPLSLLQGADGSTPYLRATSTHLEWSPDEVEWFPLVEIETLKGDDGADAYEIAVSLGYEGNREQWVEEQKGRDGDPGKSAYQLWLDAGNTGTVGDFLESLEGDDGASAEIVSATAVSGSVTAVTVGGTPLARTFQFTLPKGDAGMAAEIISVTATGLAAGATPTVVAGGTPTARTFAFGIPAGQPGSPGQQGASGMPNTDLVGTGMPNGVVTAAPGTTYKDTSTIGGLLGTNGASIWLKASGTGNTGWIVWRGNTGRRKLTLGAGLTGNVYAQRDAEFVTISMDGVANTVTGEITLLSANLASPWQSTTRRGAPVYRAGAIVGALDMNSNNVWKLTMSTQSNFLYGEITFRARPGGNTTDSWPTGALDGTSS